MPLPDSFDAHIANLATLMTKDTDIRNQDHSIRELLADHHRLTLAYLGDSKAAHLKNRIHRLAATMMAETERLRDETCGPAARTSKRLTLVSNRRVQTNQLSIWK